MKKADTHPGRHAALATGHLARAAELLASTREPLVGRLDTSTALADDRTRDADAELELDEAG